MEYRRVGRSGLKVSAVSIGGWITMGGTIEDGHARAILHAAVDNGINFVDLADVYAAGEAERVAGAALSDIPRHSLVISSKCYWPTGPGPNDRGLSRKHIVESCEASLKRLDTEYLDIYFCHRWDDETPLDETVRAMEDLIRGGKILYWGTSVWTAEQIQLAHDVSERHNAFAPIVEQPRYNLFDRHIEDDGVMQTCRDRGVGLVVWSPLAQGMLSGRYDDGIPPDSRAATTNWLDKRLTEQNVRAARNFSALAREHGLEPSQLALAWLLAHDEVSSVITGASRPEQLISNAAAADIELTASLRAEVTALFDGISWV